MALNLRKNPKRINFIYILILIILALSVRLLFFHDYKNTAAYPFLKSSDSNSYYIWARDIASGQLFPERAFMKWPLYAYFLAFLFKLFGPSIAIIHHLQFFLGLFSCLLLYSIAKKLFNQHIGFIAGLLYALYGLFIFFEGLLIYTSLSIFLNLLFFLVLLITKDKPTKKNFFLSGALLAVCTLAQFNVLLFGLLSFIWIFFKLKIEAGQKFLCFLSFFLILFLIIGSVTVLNYVAEEDFVLVAGNLGVNFYIGNNAQAKGIFTSAGELGLNQENMFRDARIIAESKSARRLSTSEVSNYWFGRGLDFIKANPLKSGKLFLKKIALVLSGDEFIHDFEYTIIRNKIRIFKVLLMDLRFILPFSFIGLFLGLKHRDKYIFLYLSCAVFLFTLPIFFISSRYRIMAVPYLIIFASFTLHSIYRVISQRQALRSLVLSFAAISIFIISGYSQFNKAPQETLFDQCILGADYQQNLGNFDKSIPYLKKAAQIKPESPALLFKLGVSFYEQGDFLTAKDKFKKVIEINPLFVDAYYNLGFIYNLEENYSQAVKVLEKAVNLDNDHEKAYFELGLAYKQIGNYEKAEAAFSKALLKTNLWRTQDRIMIHKERKSLVDF
tara:strand:- start:465 stop:2300 length:1836 start_codon:yes stop_codon:yes gene_type:complete